MKSSLKDRMTVTMIFVVLLLVISAIVYTILGNPKASGMKTTVTDIVKADNLQQIELYKKRIDPYAIKVQENNEFYLKYYDYDNNVPKESKYDLTADQYNKLVEGKRYWFEVKFSKKGDETNGIIKKVYDENQ